MAEKEQMDWFVVREHRGTHKRLLLPYAYSEYGEAVRLALTCQKIHGDRYYFTALRGTLAGMADYCSPSTWRLR